MKRLGQWITLLVLFGTAKAQETVHDATTLWLNQTSSVYYSDIHRRTYMGWVSSTGTIMIGAYDHDLGQMLSPVPMHQWPISDDHGAPAIHVITKGPDKGKLLIAYALHNSTLFCRRTTNPEDISAWDPVQTITTRKSTYPKLAELSNGLIYVLFRGDAKGGGQSMGVLKGSPNGGRSWGADVDVVNFGPATITYPGALRSFGNRLHILFNVPALGGTSQTVYHAWRDETGVWRKANGTALTLPITQSSMPSIYTGPSSRNLVLGDLRLDPIGRPVLTFMTSLPYVSTFGASCPAYRAKFNGSFWQVKSVPSAVQIYYPSGLVIDPQDTDRLVSVARIGGEYELRSYMTVNEGTTWSATTLVRQPQPMTRPVFVENGTPEFRLTWLDVTRYNRYTDFLTNLRLGN
jgi:BNR repeat-containing family member